MQRSCRRGLHRTSGLVLALLVATSVLVYGVSRQVREEDESRLLRARADELLTVLTTFSDSIEAQVSGSTIVAQVTDGDPLRWAREVEPAEGDTGGYVLYQRNALGFAPIAATGAPTAGPGISPDVQAKLQAASEGELVIVGLFGEGFSRTLGVAAGRPGRSSDFVTYYEFSLAAQAGADGATADPLLFDNTSAALYLGEPTSPENLIFAFGQGDPLGDDHAVVGTSIGTSRIVLVMAARG
ncbi:MAG: hypothetical protein QOH68_3985, partial [Nocardioidaceae bacterium]|nr:hypothetical protein [Nocardioidaceae bacterium]